MNSLQKIKALDIRHTFPAHREFTGEIHERIDTLINHHMDRLQEILSAVASYPNCSAYETAGRISWSARGRAWTDFSPNQKWFAMGETLAHLKWLQDRQYVIRTSDNGYLALCQTL